MKTIVFGTSLSGKTTRVRLLRKDHDLNISEMDEELTKINNGVFPEDSEMKHNVLAPKIVKHILNQENILFFCNTDYFSDQDIINAKKLGFKIIQLDVKLEELKKRNRYRMDHEGYGDMSQWLDGMVEYQDHIFDKDFVDKRIDATQSSHKIVQKLLEYLSK